MSKKINNKTKERQMDNSNLIEQMKRALQQAEVVVQELTDENNYLKSKPLVYAVVIKTGNIKKLEGPDKKSDFKKGTKVRIKPTSLDKYNVGFPAGTIEKISGEIAIVRTLDNNLAEIQLGDLTLQNKSQVEVETLTVCTPSGIKETLSPEKIKVNVGMVVLITENGVVIDTAPVVPFGNTATVKEVINEDYCDISQPDGSKTIFTAGHKVSKGDVVVLDPSGSVVLQNRKQDDSEFNVGATINVSWEQIGGLTNVKNTVREMIELPHTNPNIFKSYKKKAPKGILLYGPPGCGKTLVAKATASTLAKIYGGDLKESGFIYVKGPEILNPYVGVAESTIRSIFERARRYKTKTGFPATIFIDEAEAVLARRGSGISSDVNKTIVPMFLTEMDGLEDSGAFIILATNRADMLDDAVIREGRIDLKMKIDRPDERAVMQIATINFEGIPTAEPVEDLCLEINRHIFSGKLAKSVSGAMVAGIVQQAISSAIRRDLNSKAKNPSGVNSEDIVNAIKKIEVIEKEELNLEEIEM